MMQDGPRREWRLDFPRVSAIARIDLTEKAAKPHWSFKPKGSRLEELITKGVRREVREILKSIRDKGA